MSVKSPIPTDEGTKARLDKIIASAGAANLTAQDLVLTSVREAILTAALPPGSRLRQEKLAEMFGTSRIPVREALRALEYEGLVSSIPYRGFTVTELDADDIEEVYDLRILLESHAIRLAVPLMTDDDLAAPRFIQGRETTVLGAIYHVVEHFAMHTGQIVLLTKIHAPGAIHFYEDGGDLAKPLWKRGDDVTKAAP